MEVWIKPKDQELEIGGEGADGFLIGRDTCAKAGDEEGSEGVTGSVSGRHCVLRILDGKLKLADLKSTNGTYVGVDPEGIDVKAELAKRPTPLGQPTIESALVAVQVGTEPSFRLLIVRITGTKVFDEKTEVEIDPRGHWLVLVGPQEREGHVLGQFVPEGTDKYRLVLRRCKMVIVSPDEAEEPSGDGKEGAVADDSDDGGKTISPGDEI